MSELPRVQVNGIPLQLCRVMHVIMQPNLCKPRIQIRHDMFQDALSVDKVGHPLFGMRVAYQIRFSVDVAISSRKITVKDAQKRGKKFKQQLWYHTV